MTIAQLPPFDLRTVYPWMQPDAIFAAHFEQGQYWLDDAKGPIAASSLLTTTRSSSIVLPDSAGVFQTLGNNTLPRTDRGLYANGQSSRLNEDQNFNPIDTTGLSSRNSAGLDIVARGSWPSAVEAAFAASPLRSLAVTSALRVTCPGSVVNEGVSFLGTLPALTNGIASAFVFVESGAKPLIGLSATTQVLSGMEVADGFERTVNPVLSSNSRVMAIATNHTVAAAASTFWVILANLTAGTFATPPIAHPDTTLLASDIRAVQGVRPSNSQPEPFPGWEAAGLDDGFTFLIRHEGRNRGAVNRRLAGINGSSGFTRIETATNGSQFRVVGNDGTNNSFQANGGITGGAMASAFTMLSDGSVSLARSGVGTVNSGTIPYPVEPQILSIGSTIGINPWNDWIYELQICKPLSDAELLEWVNA